MSAQARRSINATAQTVVDYAPDPHGGWLASSLQRRAGQWLNSARPVVERSATWHGPIHSPQQFRGAAAIGAGKPISQRAATINDQVSTTDSVVQDVFRSRMARGVRG